MPIRRVVPNIHADQLTASQNFFVDVLGFEIGMNLGWIITFVSPDNPTAQVNIISHHKTQGHKDDQV